MKTVIITGASSGLGREFLHAAVKLCPEAEEFWLIARREDRLRELAETVPGKRCRILALDLSVEDCLKEYAGSLAEHKPEIIMLINNAGYGKLGNAADIPAAEQAGMVKINCAALTAVTVMSLRYMKKGGCLIFVSSIAAFSPNPRLTVYGATKAFVLAFSRGLRYELKERGINALAVCPGPMETEFTAVADIDGRSKFFERLPRCSVSKVAEKSIKKAKAGRAVYTERVIYKFYRILAKILPKSITIPLGKC